MLEFNKTDFKVGDSLVRGELFNPGCQITESKMAFVDSLAKFLIKNKNVCITIEIYTEVRGDAKMNMSRTEVCGKSRLQGWFKYTYKIDESRINYVCYGEDKPLITQKEAEKIKDVKAREAAYTKNRRTVVIITKT